MAREPVRSTLLWRAYARVYDRLWDTPLTASLGDEIAALALPGHVIEEVGAGTGLVTARLLARGLTVRSSEPNPAMASRFRQRFPDRDLLVESFDQVARIGAEPVTVVAANVLHVTDDPARSLASLRVLAGAGGRVVVATPVHDATVTAAANAHRRAGAGWWHWFTFVATHVALAPLSARSARTRRRGFALVPAGSEVSRVGVCRLLVFDGLAGGAARPLLAASASGTGA